MTINSGLAEPSAIPEVTRQEAREARGRRRVVGLVMLAAVARTAVDRRTLAGVIVLAVGLVAVKQLASERGTPGLDWYRALGRDESRSSA
jgi:hypothetical protein